MRRSGRGAGQPKKIHVKRNQKNLNTRDCVFFLNENEMKVKDQMEKIMKTDTEDTHVKISLGFGIV